MSVSSHRGDTASRMAPPTEIQMSWNFRLQLVSGEKGSSIWES